MRGWSPGGDHCSPQFAHRSPLGIRWFMTPRHWGHSIDSGILVDCKVACFIASCFNFIFAKCYAHPAPQAGAWRAVAQRKFRGVEVDGRTPGVGYARLRFFRPSCTMAQFDHGLAPGQWHPTHGAKSSLGARGTAPLSVDIDLGHMSLPQRGLVVALYQ
jgi:hypothetical protein